MTTSVLAVTTQNDHMLTDELAQFVRQGASAGATRFEMSRKTNGNLSLTARDESFLLKRNFDRRETEEFEECLTHLPFSAHGRIAMIVIEGETWAVQIGRNNIFLGRLSAPQVAMSEA